MNAAIEANRTQPAGENDTSGARPITILILALGGEGGGVLADWVVDAAIEAGYPVQGSSVPGVAQRTGATSYYIELLPGRSAAAASRHPVFCLAPTPGQIDLVLSSELLETGRALERGLIDPQRTLLISSTSRVLSVAEKMQMADGRFGDARIIEAARTLSREAVLFDMAQATQAAGTVISAVMFGALAASGVLPLTMAQCEARVRDSGRGAEASLRGFAAGVAALGAHRLPASPSSSIAPVPAGTPGDRICDDAHDAHHAHDDRDNRVETREVLGMALPITVAELAQPGVDRLIDHQDRAYARQYLGRIGALCNLERQAGGAPGFPVSRTAARFLALWMAYEDVIRVADLKSRAGRFERIRAEVGAGAGEPVLVRDFMKPGVDEVAAILPPSAARRLQRWAARRGVKTFGEGIRLQTSAIAGLLAMRMLASLRGWRRRSSRFIEEQALIERWFTALCQAQPRSPKLALEIAECPRLIKGYSDTYARGKRNFVAILESLIEAPAHRSIGAQPPAASDDEERAAAIRRARDAALGDPEGRQLAVALGKPLPQPREQVIRFVQARRSK